MALFNRWALPSTSQVSVEGSYSLQSGVGGGSWDKGGV